MPSSRDIIKKLKKAGWELDRTRGDHHIFKHPSNSGLAVVPHPNKDMKRGTVRSIERVTGLSLWP